MFIHTYAGRSANVVFKVCRQQKKDPSGNPSDPAACLPSRVVLCVPICPLSRCLYPVGLIP